MVHNVTNGQCWPSSRGRDGNQGNRHHMAHHLLRDQESLFNASRGAQCRPSDSLAHARDVGVALRVLADSWLHERQVGYQMRTIADEVNARHRRRRHEEPT